MPIPSGQACVQEKLVKQNIKQVDPLKVETILACYVSANSGS